ncbi:MAG: transcriptional repressor [Acidimicrobiia bacterium]|jgi:Fe2+ or Zn2+ uptake regulation protein|nr:transcriptional repressor [Acidimicrobiia bacterium]
MKKNPRNILSEKNVSITNPRILVIEELLNHKKPLTIDLLQKNLKGKIALSTLYRVLNDLKKINVIKEFNTPEKETVVELSIHEEEDHHHHIFCKKCGDVQDINLSSKLEVDLDKEIIEIQNSLKFTVEEHTLELIGICSNC